MVFLQLTLASVASSLEANTNILQFNALITNNNEPDANLNNLVKAKPTIDDMNTFNQIKQENSRYEKVDNNLNNIIKSGSDKIEKESPKLNVNRKLKNKMSNVFNQIILTTPKDNTTK